MSGQNSKPELAPTPQGGCFWDTYKEAAARLLLLEKAAIFIVEQCDACHASVVISRPSLDAGSPIKVEVIGGPCQTYPIELPR